MTVISAAYSIGYVIPPRISMVAVMAQATPDFPLTIHLGAGDGRVDTTVNPNTAGGWLAHAYTHHYK